MPTNTKALQVAEPVGFVAGKNKIINGDFGVWQRGTSFNSPANSFFADRFLTVSDGTYGTTTYSRQSFTPGTCPSGYEAPYFMRYERTVAGSGGSFHALLNQRVEDVRTFAGQTVTLSFWAKGTITTALQPGALQIFGTGGSPSGSVGVGGIPTFNVTTSWQRFSFTFTLGSMSGKTIGTNNDSYVIIYIDVNRASLGQVDLWGMQLEAGSVATPFQTATGTAQGELAACQRYYIRYQDGALYSTYVQGAAFNTTTVQLPFQFPVTMRVAPTSFEYGNVQLSDGGTAYSGGSWSIGGGAAGKTITQAIYTHGSAALTTFRPYRLENANNVNGYVAFSAEL